MAAIVPDEDFDLIRFHAYLLEHLPEYAPPMCLRLLATIDVTGIFKSKKQELLRGIVRS